MTINEIAKAHGISASAVKKWPLQKRKQAIADLSHGIDPIIAGLVAECAMEAYRASKRTGFVVNFQPYFGNHGDLVNCFYVTAKEDFIYLSQNRLLTKDELNEVLNGLRALEKL